MDRMMELVKRYRYGALILLIGIGLMCLPERKPVETDPVLPEIHQEADLEEKLASILSGIEGVGDTRVMLTIAAGERTVYQQKQDSSSSENTQSSRLEAIVITDENRREQALVEQVLPPVYQGAIIVCRGGDQPRVQLEVVEAVANVTGLSADKITVLKMK